MVWNRKNESELHRARRELLKHKFYSNMQIDELFESESNKITQKQIEETAEETARVNNELACVTKRKEAVLQKVTSDLIDLAFEEEWWKQIRDFVAMNINDKQAQNIVLIFSKQELKGKRAVWSLHAFLDPTKGKKRVEIDLG